MTDPAASFGNLLALINQEVGPIPPGPARNKRMIEVVTAHLNDAQTDFERRFFKSMLARLQTLAHEPQA